MYTDIKEEVVRKAEEMAENEEIAERDRKMEDEVEVSKKRGSEEVERSTKSKKQKVVKRDERGIKNAKAAAADDMARTIFDFQASRACTTCAELKEKKASLTAELESSKDELAKKDQEIEFLRKELNDKRTAILNLEDQVKDLISAVDAKKTVIRNLEEQLAKSLAQTNPTKSHRGL